MAKIILNDGTEEYLSPGAARRKVAAGEATFPTPTPMYSTRQMVAEKPREVVAEKPKKRKRRTKAEIEAESSSEESV